MGLLEPTETELNEMGISPESYKDNWIAMSKVSAIAKWFKAYSVVIHGSHNVLVMSLVAFVVGAGLEGDKVGALEGVQNVFIHLIIYSGCASFHWHHDGYLTILQTLDKGIFDYEGTLDSELEEELKSIKTLAHNHKKMFSQVYTVNQCIIWVGLLLKKPMMCLIEGKGERLTDGENGLIRLSAFYLYVPFAQYWGPYILGIIFCIYMVTVLDVGVLGYMTTFQFFSEDLLAEFAIINRTLNTCVKRAERLFEIRYQGTKFTDARSRRDSMDECLRFCVNLSIKHHHQTLKLFDILKEIMFWPLFILFVGWALMICISVYLLLSDDVTLFIKLPLVPLTISECVVALIFCYYGELLCNASEAIGSSIYDGERWSDYSHVLKPYASITRSYCFIPNSFTAGGFGNVNHNMFSNLCSTAYSYMGFMLST